MPVQSADAGVAIPDNDLKPMADAIRALAMDAVEAAKSGHPGMPMGMADVATVLFARHLSFDASDPDWLNRDRFILSAGHGSMLAYALLYLTGTPGMSLDALRQFRQIGQPTAGHPEYGHAPGIETTTGPLGQGIANSVGFALAERMWNARLGDDLVDHHTYVIAGDGCLMEGISQEAISLAGHLGLGRLIVLFDDNGISIDGPTSLATSEDQLARVKASGWNAMRIDGHDHAAIDRAIGEAKSDPSKPWLIACRTTIGYGAPNKGGSAGVHGAPLGADEIAATRAELGWQHGPFEIPDDILASWRKAGARSADAKSAWAERWEASSADGKAQRAAVLGGGVSQAFEKAIIAAKQAAISYDGKPKATRVWSQDTLAHLQPAVPALLGGSADLTGSNNTKTGHNTPVTAENYGGDYIHYGVREHGMAAAMNGLALYGGFIPYGGTFLVFTDYCRPAIRLSALMKTRVVYVMTHDSIGLGEDGPTHQPVEHLSALRAIPNLHVFRPADGVETAEAWELAISRDDGPSILALTRQGVTPFRTEATSENRVAKGAYVIREPSTSRDVTLLATGSEVGLALEAAEALERDGIDAAVVSMPSMERFRAQDGAYKQSVLGDAPRVAVEAGIGQCWHEWIGRGGAFVGMDSFGASGPGPALYEHFGITAKRVAAMARQVCDGAERQ
ncbi:MAG: transketolase [Pseudomonadota bacterium]